jgi:glutamyl-tRNA(Gln) amidotransferase subunit D
MQIVRIHTHSSSYEGVLLHSTTNTITLKLSNGYNVGIRKAHIVKEEVLGEKQTQAKPAARVVQGNLPLISILHLGGTIASKVDYTTGATTAQFNPEELLQMFPELREVATIESKLLRNMQSENMQPGHYNIVSKAIAEELTKKPKGIIISHGTDTMQYTAAALSFILENIPVPVILVGSQRSSDRGSSDAAMNLMCAAQFILNTQWKGVGICMHKTSNDDVCWILPGTNAVKMHTARRDAFRPVNSQQIADVDAKTKTITYYRDDCYTNGEFKLKLIDPHLKIGLVKLHPGMRHTELQHYTAYDGLVLEGTGLGHAPIVVIDEETTENGHIFDAIKQLTHHLPVCMTSQCIYGRTSLQVYSPGRMLQDIGVLGHNTNMTSTTAYIKLWWLLSNHREDVKTLYGENLRGEVSDRSEASTFLL